MIGIGRLNLPSYNVSAGQSFVATVLLSVFGSSAKVRNVAYSKNGMGFIVGAAVKNAAGASFNV